jgi:monoamine oxidase
MKAIERTTASAPSPDALSGTAGRNLDAISVQQWCDRNARNPKVQAMVAVTCRIVFGAEPSELSMLYFLCYLKSGGGLERLISIADGAQQDRLVGGTQQISIRLAEALEGTVLLNAPVHTVTQDNTSVTVHAQEHTVRAQRVVIAVPPPLCARMTFEPPLPASRAQLHQRMPMGHTIKCIAVYKEAFWRDAGLSGEVVCGDGPLSVVFDNTTNSGVPALLGFLVGAPARRWGLRTTEERRGMVLDSFSRWFGEKALEPETYLEKDWADEIWTRGCPIAYTGPDVLSIHGPALRDRIGRIHWAGTETATEWTGFMEGALQAGERAAEEVQIRDRGTG